MTCAHCFREMAEVDVSIGDMPRMKVHRNCLEEWIKTIDGQWMRDGAMMWASWLNGNMARVAPSCDISRQGRIKGHWWQVWNSNGVVANGRGSSTMDAIQRAERAAT